jgi:uncharacterized membrane protein SirB2
MINYETYKIIHLTSIVLMLTCFSVQCYVSQKSKIHSIFSGIATLLILISGMGLIARIGIGHGESWPFWIKAKVTLWFIIGVGTPVVIKRFPGFKKNWFWVNIALFAVASYLAIYKP